MAGLADEAGVDLVEVPLVVPVVVGPAVLLAIDRRRAALLPSSGRDSSSSVAVFSRFSISAGGGRRGNGRAIFGCFGGRLQSNRPFGCKFGTFGDEFAGENRSRGAIFGF